MWSNNKNEQAETKLLKAMKEGSFTVGAVSTGFYAVEIPRGDGDDAVDADTLISTNVAIVNLGLLRKKVQM